jgi:GAF domain-containing protein
MAEDLIKINGTRADQYANLYPQIQSLLAGETDLYANLGNIAAAIHDIFGFFWVGFYLVKKDQLVLGPFQGPVACTRINSGKGVCGTSWLKKETIIVDDVETFPGHIACSSLSKSEIVLPLLDQQNTVIGVLDVDSDSLNYFDNIDELYLTKIINLLKF